MENEHELSYKTLTRVYLGSYEHYKGVGSVVEPLEPGFEFQGSKMEEDDMIFQNHKDNENNEFLVSGPTSVLQSMTLDSATHVVDAGCIFVHKEGDLYLACSIPIAFGRIAFPPWTRQHYFPSFFYWNFYGSVFSLGFVAYALVGRFVASKSGDKYHRNGELLDGRLKLWLGVSVHLEGYGMVHIGMKNGDSDANVEMMMKEG
ncbi:hypothetical protein Tco_0828957 [Tanacetum coccineum]